jgi:hypothetical protein
LILLAPESGFSFIEVKAILPPRGSFVCYLSLRTRASLRRSAVNAMPAPMMMRASVALKLPGAMQLMQVPMIVGASYTVRDLP